MTHKRELSIAIEPRVKDGSSKIFLKVKAYCYSDKLQNEMDCVVALIQDVLDEHAKGGD